MPKHKNTVSFASMIEWTLKLDGDIQDDTGKSSAILFDRVVQRCKNAGIRPPAIKQFRSAISTLRYTMHSIDGETGGHSTYSINLVKNPTSVNPFAGTAVAIPSAENGEVARVINEVEKWSLTNRIDLIHALSATLKRDMGAFREVVIEGI